MNFNRKLVLADGTVFPGNGFGSNEEIIAELIFYTGMTGYQEVLTDPSYHNQMVVMTYPMIGNYGISSDENVSTKNGASALIVKEYCEAPSNWRSTKTLEAFLNERNITGLCDVDTRALTIKLREEGTMKGIIVDYNVSVEDALASLLSSPTAKNHVNSIALNESYKIPVKKKKFRVALLSFGAKVEGIVTELVNRDCEVLVVPFDASAEDLNLLGPDGIVLGSGPGNPADLVEVIPVIKEISENYPIFGINLGYHLIALAFGATTSKMKFGHHGENIPVKDINTGRTLITSQNHLFQVDESSLNDANLKATHYAINGNTVAGIAHDEKAVFGVQFSPEVHVGPADSAYLFDQFVNSLGGNGNA